MELLEEIKQDIKDIEEAQDDVEMCKKWKNYEDMGFSQNQLILAREKLIRDVKKYIEEMEGK